MLNAKPVYFSEGISGIATGFILMKPEHKREIFNSGCHPSSSPGRAGAGMTLNWAERRLRLQRDRLFDGDGGDLVIFDMGYGETQGLAFYMEGHAKFCLQELDGSCLHAWRQLHTDGLGAKRID